MQNVRMKSAVFECWAPDYFRGFGVFLVQGKVRAKVPLSVTVDTGFALLFRELLPAFGFLYLRFGGFGFHFSHRDSLLVM